MRKEEEEAKEIFNVDLREWNWSEVKKSHKNSLCYFKTCSLLFAIRDHTLCFIFIPFVSILLGSFSLFSFRAQSSKLVLIWETTTKLSAKGSLLKKVALNELPFAYYKESKLHYKEESLVLFVGNTTTAKLKPTTMHLNVAKRDKRCH